MAQLTKKQKFGLVALGLFVVFIALVIAYFKTRKQTELCPNGSPIPASGNCADSLKGDTSGGVLPNPKPDANGCVQPSSYKAVSFPISLGMAGPEVKAVQTYLNKNKGAVLTVDDYFGCHTQSAVIKAFGTATVDQNSFNTIINAGLASNNSYTQIPPIDGQGCDYMGNNAIGVPCSAIV